MCRNYIQNIISCLAPFFIKNKESLEQTYEEIKSIPKEFQQNKILEKMKKKLPV